MASGEEITAVWKNGVVVRAVKNDINELNLKNVEKYAQKAMEKLKVLVVVDSTPL